MVDRVSWLIIEENSMGAATVGDPPVGVHVHVKQG